MLQKLFQGAVHGYVCGKLGSVAGRLDRLDKLAVKLYPQDGRLSRVQASKLHLPGNIELSKCTKALGAVSSCCLKSTGISLPTQLGSQSLVNQHRTWMLGPLKYVVTELAPQDRVSGNSKEPSACEPLIRPLKLSVRHWAPGAATKPIARIIAEIMASSGRMVTGQICQARWFEMGLMATRALIKGS